MSENKLDNAHMTEQERALFSEQLSQQVNLEAEQEVPHWNREEAFEQHFQGENKASNNKSINWGMWFGIPALSMACSAFAITVVMSFINNKGMDQQALTALIDQQVQQRGSAQLAGQPGRPSLTKSNDEIETLINLKLREFAAEQQVVLANYRADMSVQQQKSNLALASYVIGASRKERKEDMSDFISFINAQREDEQLTQKIKFQQLEREVSLQRLGLQQKSAEAGPAKPVNYKG
jgi:hypothetical protein